MEYFCLLYSLKYPKCPEHGLTHRPSSNIFRMNILKILLSLYVLPVTTVLGSIFIQKQTHKKHILGHTFPKSFLFSYLQSYLHKIHEAPYLLINGYVLKYTKGDGELTFFPRSSAYKYFKREENQKNINQL